MADGDKSNSDASLHISPAHAGALAARMLILEEGCREIERDLDGFHGILYEYAGEIPESVKHRMRALLAEILDKLESISLELGLRKQVVELDKLIESRLSRIWVTLHESKSRGLRGYGAVSSIACKKAAAAWRWKFASCCTKSAASLSRRSRTPAPRKRRESRPSRRLAHGLTDWNSRYASCSAELVSMVWKETQGHERRCHPEPFAVTLSEAKGRQLARSE